MTAIRSAPGRAARGRLPEPGGVPDACRCGDVAHEGVDQPLLIAGVDRLRTICSASATAAGGHLAAQIVLAPP